MDHHCSLLTTAARQRRQIFFFCPRRLPSGQIPFGPLHFSTLAIFGDRGPKSVKKWKFWGKVKNFRKKILVQNWLYGPPLLTSDLRDPTTTTKKKFSQGGFLRGGCPILGCGLSGFRGPGGPKSVKMWIFREKSKIFEKKILVQNWL